MEKNIDYRLDLFNAVDKFNENMNPESDALFIISKSNDGDNFSALTGNAEILYLMLSRFDFIENLSNEQKESFKSMQAFILNSAFTILMYNENDREIFINELKKQFKL
jgi:hypothetical protein